ncbi:sigma-70 family RNA polymerase sigma factor [Occultella glacieicola]|uniref:Sigma-70 family RNA polymerase sigma factor n=1 Tax=Occultella glacieicola TaxID=2518684 RepID=A0ABY2E5M4_9MICO|nr:sigma-70 family RNA polymerase sigma factor [Occultella glacieicola]TDE94147.1 sigma-70 family RNA polymerase sigma factor [Occultella glacieicola]
MTDADDGGPERRQAAEFETHRRYLTTVAYRMLGSFTDAEDAVQEAWLRLQRSDARVDDLRAWLTRVVSRICLDTLRSRGRRREEPLAGVAEADPATAAPSGEDPAALAETADSVGIALMIVLDHLSPDERLAYVLHDVFGLPFDEISGVLDRTPQAARKLASRGRARIRGTDSPSRPRSLQDRARQRALVEAFLAAGRDGDFDGLLAILHPDVVLRVDHDPEAGGMRIVRGAAEVANGARRFRTTAAGGEREFAIIEVADTFGVLTYTDGRPTGLLIVTGEDGLITHLHAVRP